MRYYDSLKNLEPIKFNEDDSLPILEANNVTKLLANFTLDNKAFYDLAKDTLINKRIDKELFNDGLTLDNVKGEDYQTIFSNIQYLLENAEDIEIVKLAFSLFINAYKYINNLNHINKKGYHVFNRNDYKELTSVIKLYLLDSHVEELILSYNLDIKGILKKFYKEKEQYYQYLEVEKNYNNVINSLCRDTIYSIYDIYFKDHEIVEEKIVDNLEEATKKLNQSFELQNFLRLIFVTMDTYKYVHQDKIISLNSLKLAFELISIQTCTILDFDFSKINKLILLLHAVNSHSPALYIFMCMLISVSEGSSDYESDSVLALLDKYSYLIYKDDYPDYLVYFYLIAFKQYFDYFKDDFKRMSWKSIQKSACLMIHGLKFQYAYDFYILGYLYSLAKDEDTRCAFLESILASSNLSKSTFEKVEHLGKVEDRYVTKGIMLYIFKFINFMSEDKLSNKQGKAVVSIISRFPPQDAMSLDLACFFTRYLKESRVLELAAILLVIDGVKILEKALKTKKPLETSLYHIKDFYNYDDNRLFLERYYKSPHENMNLIEAICSDYEDSQLDPIFQALENDLSENYVPNLKTNFYPTAGSLNVYCYATIPTLLASTKKYYPNIYRYGVVSPMYFTGEKYIEALLSLDVNLFINDDILFEALDIAIYKYEYNEDFLKHYHINIDKFYELRKLRKLAVN